jgi:hypothetical protein
MPLDEDGFAVPGEPTPSSIRRLPPMVNVGETFDGCDTRDEAVAKVINALSAPASTHFDGFDAMYRRLADGLIMLLARKEDLIP